MAVILRCFEQPRVAIYYSPSRTGNALQAMMDIARLLYWIMHPDTLDYAYDNGYADSITEQFHKLLLLFSPLSGRGCHVRIGGRDFCAMAS